MSAKMTDVKIPYIGHFMSDKADLPTFFGEDCHLGPVLLLTKNEPWAAGVRRLGAGGKKS